jgi:ubiquinone/menaquinone biosynthesis C-methylase UbiE
VQIVGVDLSPEMLNQARSKDLGGNVEWIEADVQRLPLADRSFDVAVCANSFHYFRAPAASLEELHRVLRPGGTLVLADWCDDFLACKLCRLWLQWADPAFFRTYTQAECRRLLEEAGFVVEQTEIIRVGWIWGLMRLTCRRAGNRDNPRSPAGLPRRNPD